MIAKAESRPVFATGAKAEQMKTSIFLAAMVLGSSLPPAAVAQNAGAAANASEVVGMTVGVVKKLDNDRQKITLQHEALENLGMPPMTVDFRLGKECLTENVDVGDRILFRAERIDGAFVVTRLQKVDSPSYPAAGAVSAANTQN